MITEMITVIFFIFLLSYYIILLIPKKNHPLEKTFRKFSVIIPAHNEEEYIEECINSVMRAKGNKEIIVINDGSKDKTQKILDSFKGKINIIRADHIGKSASINKALKIATGDIIAIVDGDSIISEDSLVEISKEVGRKGYGASTCVVKVKNKNKFIGMWLNIEQLYNSLMRSIFSKINANVTTPGPLSAYRKDALDKIGGFSTEGFSEDVDITIRLIRQGYRVGFAENAISETNMPYTLKGFLRQRFRFARGMLNIFKRHVKLNKSIIDLYTLPLLIFTYIQAVIMGSFTIYQIIQGYLHWFVSKGMYISLGVIKYFFNWFSIVGFIDWTYRVFSGSVPLDAITLIGILSTFLSYPLFFYAVYKYERSLSLYHIIPLFFMAPFWWTIMIIYILSLPEMFMKKQYNRWKKNE